MKDGAILRVVKRAARWRFWLDLRASRALRRPAPYVLAGACRRSGGCCEAPSIQVGRLVFSLPRLRALFLWWQERVNGFVLEGRDAAGRTFVFRCTHFDRATRSCDSYDSRPGMCRDYPRALLDQPAPEFLPGCGYRPLLRNAAALRRSLEAASVPEQTLRELKRKLRLE